MTFLAKRLKHRVQIQEATMSGGDLGGFEKTYTTLLTIWAEIKKGSVVSDFVSVIRGEALDNQVTHEFRVRRSAVVNLGRGFTIGFSTGYDQIADLNPLKSEYYIFLQEGSATKGRLFRIVELRRDEINNEYIWIRAREYEEKGTGYPE